MQICYLVSKCCRSARKYVINNSVMSAMQDFAAKRDALFASLDEASKEIKKNSTLDQSCADSYIHYTHARGCIDVLSPDSNRENFSPSLEARTKLRGLRRMCGKESIFKKPELPISQCLKPRRAPDYQLNPHKWIKYSLIDVDISDQTNKAAAFAFLKQMDEQREAKKVEGEVTSSSMETKIEFKKSAKLRNDINERNADSLPDPELDKPKLRGSKLVMPEYVIGQKLQRTGQKLQRTKREDGPRAAGGTLKLPHLVQEYDDNDEEDELVDK